MSPEFSFIVVLSFIYSLSRAFGLLAEHCLSFLIWAIDRPVGSDKVHARWTEPLRQVDAWVTGMIFFGLTAFTLLKSVDEIIAVELFFATVLTLFWLPSFLSTVVLRTFSWRDFIGYVRTPKPQTDPAFIMGQAAE